MEGKKLNGKQEDGKLARRLAPGHMILVQQEINQFNTITQGNLGMLGHGQDGADRFSDFQGIERRNSFVVGFFKFRPEAGHFTPPLVLKAKQFPRQM